MNNQVCAVVGAGPAMGNAIAKAFADEGCTVVLMARNRENLDNYARELRGERAAEVHTQIMDATDRSSVEQAFDEIRRNVGAIDILVYNPAVLKKEAPSEIEPNALVDTLGIMLFGAMHCVRTVLPSMRERGSGTILFTGGGFGIDPSTTFASHSIGKAALRNYANGLFLELKDEGIHAATVTITRPVEEHGDHTKEAIASRYVQLHNQERSHWDWEIIK
ncbi:MAG: SDR family NAD(P)-dependent oxidoreductase [Spirochaetota bacterium]